MKAIKAKRTTTKKAMKATNARKRTTKKAMKATNARKRTNTATRGMTRKKFEYKKKFDTFQKSEKKWPTVGYDGWFLVALEWHDGWVKEIWLRRCEG